MISNFINFNEQLNKNNLRENIEDCSIDFCDDYDVNFHFESGSLINNVWTTGDMTNDIIRMAKKSEKHIDIKEAYSITFSRNETHKRKGIKDFEDFNLKKIDKLNIDLRKLLDRVLMLNPVYEIKFLKEVTKMSWRVSFLIVKTD